MSAGADAAQAAVQMGFLPELVALLAATGAIAYICIRIGVVPIVGFLLAGVLIGPHALGWVCDQHLIDSLAELGVVLLLFTIGIEFSLEKLASIQRFIFLGGGLQVGLTVAAVTLGLRAFGVGWPVSAFSGCLIALSSTAIVLKLLGDRGETNTRSGQAALGILISQDLAVVIMVLLIPMFGGNGASLGDAGLALAKALAIIAAVLVLARWLMPRLLEVVARACSAEVFLLTIIAICFGTAWLTSLAGLSLALGAFLAGLVVSESRFSHHALGEILPLQILFSAAFFVSVGMLLDLRFLAGHPFLVLAVVAGVVVLKVLTTGISATLLGLPVKDSIMVSFLLAQVGEFSFVLERSGRAMGLYPAGIDEMGGQTFIAASVLLMVFTPLLAKAGRTLQGALAEKSLARDKASAEAEALPDTYLGKTNHVIVAGYGQAGRQLTRVLKTSGIPYIILTLSPTGAHEAEDEGMPVLRGDYTRQHTLDHAGIAGAKALIIGDDDPATARRVVSVARMINPTLHILVRTRYRDEMQPLREEGADTVISDELESTVQLFLRIMEEYRIPMEQVESHARTLRSQGYASLLSDAEEAPKIICQGLDQHCLDTRTVTVRPGAPIIGRKPAQASLGEKYGLVLHGARRRTETYFPAPEDWVFAAGDQLVLEGSAARFADSAALFLPPASQPGTRALPVLAPRAALPAAPGRDGLPRNMELTPAQRTSPLCTHQDRTRPVAVRALVCEPCRAMGDAWVHLRICMTCGQVGCCDSSKNKHATAHFRESGHPIIRSLEKGENWAWCNVDKTML